MGKGTANRSRGVERLPLSQIECADCGWVQEIRGIPSTCPRCGSAHSLHCISVTRFLKLVDRGEARFCAACNYIHTR